MREPARRGGDGRRIEGATEAIAMPSPGAHSRKSIARQRLAKAIALSVGYSWVGQNLDQPFVISRWKRHEPGLGDDRVEAEVADGRVQSCGLGTGDEVEASMGHTGWVRPEVEQDLSKGAGVRIDVLVVGNDLKRPDRVRGHVPPLHGAAARGHRIHAANNREAPDWRTVHSLNRSPGVAT
jgi:hypothetical protein